MQHGPPRAWIRDAKDVVYQDLSRPGEGSPVFESGEGTSLPGKPKTAPLPTPPDSSEGDDAESEPGPHTTTSNPAALAAGLKQTESAPMLLTSALTIPTPQSQTLRDRPVTTKRPGSYFGLGGHGRLHTLDKSDTLAENGKPVTVGRKMARFWNLLTVH